MHVDDAAVRALERRYGPAATLAVEQPVSDREAAMVRASMRGGRRHDMTLFIFEPGGRLALIRKHAHPPGVYRAPSGGVRPGEPPDQGALREGREETGLDLVLHRYVLRVDARFRCAADDIHWQSHVFTAACADPPERPQPLDVHEIAEVRWFTPADLQGPVRAALLAAGRGLLRYRVSLTDAMAVLLAFDPELIPPHRAD